MKVGRIKIKIVKELKKIKRYLWKDSIISRSLKKVGNSRKKDEKSEKVMKKWKNKKIYQNCEPIEEQHKKE